MADRIALLGWGSLLWDADARFDASHGAWQYDGPVLKLEFSRISKSRNGVLTLVIDDQHGTPATVAYSLSNRTKPEEAIDDLRIREKTTEKKIGRFICQGASVSRDPMSLSSIHRWAEKHDFNAVVWTDLPSNFVEKTVEPFSAAAVARYLQKLSNDDRVRCREYALRALKEFQSPIRDIIGKT